MKVISMKKVISMVLACVMVMGTLVIATPKVYAEASFYWPLSTSYGIGTKFQGYAGHDGIDLPAPCGTPVYALMDGTATFYQVYTTIGGTNYLTSFGNCVYLSSGAYFMEYCHLNSFEGYALQIPSSQTRSQSGKTDKILIGSRNVKAGECLGYVGNTGNSTGNHLHFGLKVNGSYVDPELYLSSSKCASELYYGPIPPVPPTPPIDDVHFVDGSVTSNGFSVYWNFSNCSQVVVLIKSIALNQEFSLTLSNNYTYNFGVGDPSWGSEYEVRLIPDGDHSRTHYLRYGDKENRVVLPGTPDPDVHDMSEGVRFINQGVTASGFSVYWNFPNCSQVVVLIKSIALNREIGSLTLGNKYDYNFAVQSIEWGNVFEVRLIPDGDHSRTHYLRFGDIENCVVLPAATLTSISMESKPTKTVYEIGESLNTAGLKLKLHYNSGLSETITSGFTTSGFDSSTSGTKTVTVSYKGKTATFQVTVVPQPVTLTSISIASQPTKTVYGIGESLNTSGLKLTLHYSDSTTETVTDGFTTSGFDSTTAGTKTVTVTYGGHSTTFTVTVNAKADDPQIVIDSKTVHAGDTVQIGIVMKNAEALKSIGLIDFSFDSNVLELESGEWKLANSILKDVDVSQKLAAITFNDNANCNGEILVLTFAVKEDAEDGTYPVSCTVTAKQKVQAGEQDYYVAVISGNVQVSSVAKGDMDGDDVVTSDDAIYLLYHTLFPGRYPINQNADFDKNGVITSDDAIYLLYYTLFPARYPLN